MKWRSFQRRAPKTNRRFSWGRTIYAPTATVTYRLFRRDLKNAQHTESGMFFLEDSPAHVAIELRQMRKRLLDRVDRMDFAALGIDLEITA